MTYVVNTVQLQSFIVMVTRSRAHEWCFISTVISQCMTKIGTSASQKMLRCLFVTVFAQKTSMLALCTDMVLQKWVAEVIVVCHLCFLKASVYKL
jgi:hypothetical protein